MSETFTINTLGDTPKQRWLTAINIYHLTIQCNLERAIDAAEGEFDKAELDSLNTAYRTVDTFADEMRRLVEGVFE